MSGGWRLSGERAHILVWTIRQEVYVYLTLYYLVVVQGQTGQTGRRAAAMQPVCKCPCACLGPPVCRGLFLGPPFRVLVGGS